MTDIIVVDTDILIDSARGIKEAERCLQRIEQTASASISVVTQMELIIGCRNRNELQCLEQFLCRVEIVNLSESISDVAVELLSQYRLSHGLLIADALIAATAIELDCRVVSKNQRDYRFIDNLQLLSYPIK